MAFVYFILLYIFINHIYMIVGKSMPIDNYEQYKRIINQITGRLYILETKKLMGFLVCMWCVCVCGGGGGGFMTICF